MSGTATSNLPSPSTPTSTVSPISIVAQAQSGTLPVTSERQMKVEELLEALGGGLTQLTKPGPQDSVKALAEILVKRIDPLNSNWTVADPEWNKMEDLVTQALEVELPKLSRTAGILDSSFVHSFAAEISDQDLDALNIFFASAKGKRYSLFQAEASEIYARGLAALQAGVVPTFKPKASLADKDAFQQEMKPYLDLLEMTVMGQVSKLAMNDARQKNQDMSGYGASAFIQAAIIGQQQDALDKLRRDYTQDLNDIEAFNSSDLGERYYATLMRASTDLSTKPTIANVLDDFFKRHLEAWQQTYQADKQARGQAENAANQAGVSRSLYTIAGNGERGYSGEGGQASLAQLWRPQGVVVDGNENVYFSDRENDCVRKVDPSGVISTVAGTFKPNQRGFGGIAGFSGDGAKATEASLSGPNGLALDSKGNLYVADEANNRVRKVDSSGVISTIAGNGESTRSGDGASALAAGVPSPCGVAVDGEGNLYIAEFNAASIRMVDLKGIIRSVAGTGEAGFSGDGGPATAATLRYVRGVSVDSSGNFYVVDQGNSRIRKVNREGIISTVAGSGVPGQIQSEDLGDGGPATAAQLSAPNAVAVDSEGNIYIADVLHQRIRRVDASSGIITTVAGNGQSGFSGDGPALSNRLCYPNAVAFDAQGHLYIADSNNYRVRELK